MISTAQNEVAQVAEYKFFEVKKVHINGRCYYVVCTENGMYKIEVEVDDEYMNGGFSNYEYGEED